MKMKIPTHDLTHIAVPTHDKEIAKHFYSGLLGGRVAREYDDRVTFELFEHQLVCHLHLESKPSNEDIDPLRNAYPRHFGMTFLDENKIRDIHKTLSDASWPNLQPLMTRFADLPERHLTFFVADPSHNIVEFKWYENPAFAY